MDLSHEGRTGLLDGVLRVLHAVRDHHIISVLIENINSLRLQTRWMTRICTLMRLIVVTTLLVCAKASKDGGGYSRFRDEEDLGLPVQKPLTPTDPSIASTFKISEFREFSGL